MLVIAQCKKQTKSLLLWCLYSQGKIYVLSALKDMIAVCVDGDGAVQSGWEVSLLKCHLTKVRNKPCGCKGIELSGQCK